jgi:hypothetical protein
MPATPAEINQAAAELRAAQATHRALVQQYELHSRLAEDARSQLPEALTRISAARDALLILAMAE